MARRDIIVIGASLGGVDALQRLASRLPADLPASVLITLHMAPNAPNLLPALVDAAGPLPAARAQDGQELTPGRIFMAVPDRHLLIEGNRIRLTRGPRENHSRPSIDALFRSAAVHGGRRVIGVVLTGLLDDGTAGLWAIKSCGGVAIVQSPEEARCPSMPLNALANVEVDYTLRLDEIGETLRALTAAEITEREEQPMASRELDIETRIALGDNALAIGVRNLGTQSFYTCPDCHGSMVAIAEGSFQRFRCHTGHVYSANALSHYGLLEIEKNLWSMLALLEEREALLSDRERRAREQGSETVAKSLARELQETRQIIAQMKLLALSPTLSTASSTTDE